MGAARRAKDRRFDAKSCLLGCGMLLCSALPNASYAVRDGVYAAISTSAGTHRAATLFCMILIEIAFLAGGLSLLPFAEKKMDKPVAALLLAMGLIGVLLHEFALWGGGAARLGGSIRRGRSCDAFRIFGAGLCGNSGARA